MSAFDNDRWLRIAERCVGFAAIVVCVVVVMLWATGRVQP